MIQHHISLRAAEHKNQKTRNYAEVVILMQANKLVQVTDEYHSNSPVSGRDLMI